MMLQKEQMASGCSGMGAGTRVASSGQDRL